MVDDIIQFLLFLGFIGAAFRIPTSFDALISIGVITKLSSGLFFLCAAVVHLFVFFHTHPWIGLFNYTEFVALCVFLLSLSYDVQRALQRLRLAFRLVRHHNPREADQIIATITTALQGRDAR